MIHRNPILACVIKQYGTGLYRACVSLNKGHTVFLSVHQDEESADETIRRFQEACRDGTIKTAEDVLSFAGSLDFTENAINAPFLPPISPPFSNDGELSLAA